MDKMKSSGHLPVIGPGPAICFPMVLLTVAGIWSSVKGYIPGAVDNKVLNLILSVTGIFLIAAGLILYIGADKDGNLIDNIKDNKLKTNGSYKFVRNPCYSMFLLCCTGTLLIAHNLILLILPFVFWAEMSIVLINTEEKWLKDLYGQEYADYCKTVNRCIPWFTGK